MPAETPSRVDIRASSQDILLQGLNTLQEKGVNLKIPQTVVPFLDQAEEPIAGLLSAYIRYHESGELLIPVAGEGLPLSVPIGEGQEKSARLIGLLGQAGNVDAPVYFGLAQLAGETEGSVVMLTPFSSRVAQLDETTEGVYLSLEEIIQEGEGLDVKIHLSHLLRGQIAGNAIVRQIVPPYERMPNGL